MERRRTRTIQPLTQRTELEVDRIICGDSVEVLKGLPDESVDFIITSPPYDFLRIYNGNSDFSFEKFKDVARQLTRVLKRGKVLVWVVNDATTKGSKTGTSARQQLYFQDECRLNLHDDMIYEKNASAFPAKPTGIRCTQIWEHMFVFSKGRPDTVHLLCDKKNLYPGSGSGQSSQRNKNGALIKYQKKEIPEYSPRNNIWRYSVGNGHSASQKIAHEHPAIFPEALVCDHIRVWTDEGDLVLDPFNGSGTTTTIAKAMGRRFIGVDVSDEYCEIARKRLLLPIDIESLKRKSEKSNNHRCPENIKPTPSQKKSRLTTTQVSGMVQPPEKGMERFSKAKE